MSDEFDLKVGNGLGMVGWSRVTSVEERRERRERIWLKGRGWRWRCGVELLRQTPVY